MSKPSKPSKPTKRAPKFPPQPVRAWAVVRGPSDYDRSEIYLAYLFPTKAEARAYIRDGDITFPDDFVAIPVRITPLPEKRR